MQFPVYASLSTFIWAQLGPCCVFSFGFVCFITVIFNHAWMITQVISSLPPNSFPPKDGWKAGNPIQWIWMDWRKDFQLCFSTHLRAGHKILCCMFQNCCSLLVLTNLSLQWWDYEAKCRLRIGNFPVFRKMSDLLLWWLYFPAG